MSGVQTTPAVAATASAAALSGLNLLQRVHLSPDAAEMAERLQTRNPLTGIKAYREVAHLPLLTNALAMKWAYPNAARLMRHAIDNRLFTPLLHREGMDINGSYSGITGLGTGRQQAILEALELQLLPQIEERFGNERVQIRDEGSSSGAVSMEVFLALSRRYPKIRYTASDLVSALTFIGDGRGTTAIFSDAPPSRIEDDLLQLVRDGWIDLRPEPELVKPFRKAAELARRELPLPEGFVAGRISALEPRVDELLRRDRRFNVEQHDLFDALPVEARAHIAILSSVLVPTWHRQWGRKGFYEEAEILAALRSVGRNLVDGGMALVINELPVGGLDEDMPLYSFPFSAYERRDDRLELTGEFQKGFMKKRVDGFESISL